MDNKKSTIGFILIGLILMFWFYTTPKTNQQQAQNNVASSQVNDTNSSAPNLSLTPISEEDTTQEEEIITISTNIYDLKFSTKNATLISAHLKNENETNNQNNMELLPKGELGQGFRILWGDEEYSVSSADIFYNFRKNSAYSITFYKDFETSDGNIFSIEKTFEVKNDEHLLDLSIKIVNKENDILNIGKKFAYSIIFGPQLGPYAEVVDTQKSKQLSRRRLIGRDNKKVRNINLKSNRTLEKSDYYKWVGISGRYISMLILTGTTSYTTKFSTMEESGLNSGAQITLKRPKIQSSAIEDRFRIYIGPNIRSELKRYNNSEDNAFGIQEAHFEDVKPNRLLTFLEKPIYALLLLIYRLIPNYGFAIIILTLIMRAITLPVIRKSKANGEKMKQLSPKMQAIREKHSDDPMRMNQEIMALYKREQVSPFSSMLPMLIQLPFFLAMYRVIYESFDLWQAPFIGWMNDLSSPDQLIDFGDFTVPIVGWSSLHLLPIIMLATQYVSSYIMLKQQDHSAGSQKFVFMMSYVFPFMIFFVLYNSPSGLILYWICSNIFTVFSMANWKKKKVENEPIIKKKKKRLTTK